MVRVNIVMREFGKSKPEYSLEFDLPEIPEIGSYISIQRPDKAKPFGEDAIVKRVWWRLEHQETGGIAAEPPKVGYAREIFVECEPAIGPYSSAAWRRNAEFARSRGLVVEEFDIERYSVPEIEVK